MKMLQAKMQNENEDTSMEFYFHLLIAGFQNGYDLFWIKGDKI